MHMLFCFMYTASLIAFLVYWRKKVAAKRAAGVYYMDDPLYQSVSKVKRVIGVICVVSFMLCLLTEG